METLSALVAFCAGNLLLTHLPQNKMAAILADGNFKCISLNENDRIPMPQTPDIFSLAEAAWKHHKYPYFCILPLEFGVNIDIHNMKTVRFYVQTAINLQMKCLRTPYGKNMESMLIDFSWLNVQAKQRVLMHRHQGWNVRHGLCHIYMRYLYIYELFIAFVCFVVCSLL